MDEAEVALLAMSAGAMWDNLPDDLQKQAQSETFWAGFVGKERDGLEGDRKRMMDVLNVPTDESEKQSPR